MDVEASIAGIYFGSGNCHLRSVKCPVEAMDLESVTSGIGLNQRSWKTTTANTVRGRTQRIHVRTDDARSADDPLSPRARLLLLPQPRNRGRKQADEPAEGRFRVRCCRCYTSASECEPVGHRRAGRRAAPVTPAAT